MPRFVDIDSTLSAAAAEDARAALRVTGVYISGADDTGAADSLSALQAAIDGASAGDTIYLPRGKFLISAPLVIDKPLVIRGGGGMFTASNQGGTWPGVAGTTIVTSSATANGLNITAAGVVLEDFAVVNTRALASPPSAGTGIYMNNANNFRLSRMTVAGFYDCVRFEGRFGNMDSCNIFDPVRYGALLYNDNPNEEDFGDQGISNCNIAMYGRQSDADAAVRWESGGGIRFTGNKIVAGTGPGATSIGKFKYGVDIMAANTMASVEFMIAGGAISTCTQACIRMGQQSADGTSGFGSMTVSGVVIQGAGGKGILIGGAAAGLVNNIREVVITGNTFKGVTAGGIVAYNMRGLVVGPNVWEKATYTGPLITLAGSSSAGTDNQASTQQVDIARQTVVATTQDQNVTVINDRRRVATNGSLDGFVDYRYKRNVYINTAGWKTLYTIEPPDEGGSGFVDVVLAGQDYMTGGGGPWFVQKIRRSYLKTSGAGSAITIATVGTDEIVSANSTTAVNGYGPANVGLRVVDGGSGKMLVQVAMNSPSATVWGDIEVNVAGRVQKFSIGAGI